MTTILIDTVPFALIRVPDTYLRRSFSGNFGVSPSLFINAFNNSTLVQAYVEADIQLGIANQVFGAAPALLYILCDTRKITLCTSIRRSLTRLFLAI